MKMLSKLLNGENPTPAQLWVTHGVTALAVIITLFQLSFGFVALLMAVVAADWFGGIIANSARSTRAYWASLPLWTAYAFVVVHLFECAVLWWFFGDNSALLYLWLAVFAKLAVFILGQIEHRREPGIWGQPTTP